MHCSVNLIVGRPTPADARRSLGRAWTGLTRSDRGDNDDEGGVACMAWGVNSINNQPSVRSVWVCLCTVCTQHCVIDG